jgi:hypothetical protein
MYGDIPGYGIETTHQQHLRVWLEGSLRERLFDNCLANWTFQHDVSTAQELHDESQSLNWLVIEGRIHSGAQQRCYLAP